MNKQEAQRQTLMFHALEAEGVTYQDAQALRRISMALHRWHEMECGNGRGYIERDEETGVPYWYNANARYLSANDPRAYTRIPDREKGALKRLAAIMARYPHLTHYVQGDPRGAALYIWTPRNAAVYGDDIDANYSRGIAIY